MDSATSLFSHYADIPALENEKQAVLDIFAEIRAGIKALGDAGFKVDTAKTVSQMQVAVRDINKLQDNLIAKTRELEIFEQRLEALRLKNEETQKRIARLNEDIATKQANQAKLKAQEEEARTRSLVTQERELDRIIAKETQRNELARQGTENTGIVDRGLSVIPNKVGAFPQAPLTNVAMQEEIIATGEAVSQLEKEEAAAVMASNEWAASQGKVVEANKAVTVSTAEVSSTVDLFTGSLQANIAAQVENQVALNKVKAEQRALAKDIRGQGGIANEQQLAQLATLREEELQLSAANKDLNATLKQQVIALRDNEGAAAQLRAELTLLKQTYEQMSAAEKVSSFGKLTKNNINTLAPVVAELDKEMLRGRHGLDTLDSGLEKAGSRLVSFVTRDLFRAAAGFLVFTLVFKGAELVWEAFITWMNKMSDAEALAAAKLKDLNDVMKSANQEAGKEITDLKSLRSAAQDVTLPMQTRVDAVKALKKEFPEHYKNLNDEIILLGKDTIAYDQSTEAILRNSRAKAAKAKIDELEAGKLDEQFNKAKIIGTTDKEAKAVTGDKTSEQTSVIPGTGEQKVIKFVDTKEQQLERIAARKKEALDKTENKIKEYDQRENFLLQFIDKSAIVKQLTGKPTAEPLAPTDSNYYRLLKMEEQSAEAYRKFLQEEAIKEQKLVADSEFVTVNVRVKAREQALKIEKEMLGEETASKLDQIDADANKEKSKRKISQRELDLIDKDAQNKRNLVQSQSLDKLADLESKSAIDILRIKKQFYDADIKAYQDEIARIEELDRKALAKKKTDYEQRSGSIDATAAIQSTTKVDLAQQVVSKLDPTADAKKIQQVYQALEYDLLKIDRDRMDKQLQNEIDHWRDIIKTVDRGSEDYIAAENALALAEFKLSKIREEQEKEANDRIVAAHDKLMESYFRLGKEIQTAGKAFIDAGYQKQINKIQEQINLIDVLKAREIDRINATTASEQDKAAKIAIVEAKAQSDKEMLQRRQRQIDREKAKFDKVFNAFQITEDTIKTVSALKLEVTKITAESATNKFLIPLIPLVAAQIPIAIGIGAAQLAAALAVPLPAYWTGTQSSIGGWATVAEKGPELAIDPSGRQTYYTDPTVANLIKGTKIFNATDTKEILKVSEKERIKVVYGFSQPTITAPDNRQLKELEKLNKKEFKANVHIHNAPGVETSFYYQFNFKR